jgi:hypothetical protein
VPTYTVQAPDGKTITLEGPAGASQEDILAQAQALYKPKTATAPKSATRPSARAPANPVDNYAQRWSGKDPAMVRKTYEAARQSVISKIADPAKRQAALTAFDTDPRAQAMRKIAGLAPVSTRKGEVRAAAQKSFKDRVAEDIKATAKKSTSGQGFGAGFSIGAFGLPQMLAAAGLRFLPSALTGNKSNLSYSELKKLAETADNERFAANPGAGIAGALTSGILLSRGAGLGAGAAAASRAPAVARTGNVLQGLATLRKGQAGSNAAKIVGIGGTAGGLQAAGTGGDVDTGVATGIVAAPVVAGGVKVAQVLTRPFRDVLRLSSAGQILNRLTTATRDQLERRAATYRNATGAEPTLFELLPLADRNKILKTAVVGKDNIVEQTSDAIRARAQNLGPEMSARAQEILTPNRTAIQNGIRTDLANARGGALAAGDDDLIESAMDSPTDMLRLRDEEARAIMAPHDATPVVPNLEDLFPSVPGPGGTRVGVDPEVAHVIRSAAGTLRARAPDAGVTAGDITDMISTLRGDLAKGGIEGRNAERAINHLQDTLDNMAPDAGAAARRMSDAYAARSRMAEGMREGNSTRLRDDVQVGTSRRQAQTVRNAYDSPEGGAGRTLGQGNRVISDLGGSPEEALRATVKQSRGSTGRQLAQNIGATEADLLTTAARAQDESAQALASASQKAQGGSGEGADAEMLVQAIAGLHPASFITTKAGAMRKLLDMTYIPETRARTIVEMIFSQDPAMMRRALNAIGTEPNGARFVKYLSGIVGQTGANITSDNDGAEIVDALAPEADIPSVEDDLAGMEEPVDETPSVEDDLAGMEPTEEPYGRQVIKSIFPEAEVTDDIRDPDSALGRANPGSYHTSTENAVDLRPIPGMTFEQFIQQIQDEGYDVIEARDEVTNPSAHATGPHWHVVLG